MQTKICTPDGLLAAYRNELHKLAAGDTVEIVDMRAGGTARWAVAISSGTVVTGTVERVTDTTIVVRSSETMLVHTYSRGTGLVRGYRLNGDGYRHYAVRARSLSHLYAAC
jgi:3-dehydroquinate synthase class II